MIGTDKKAKEEVAVEELEMICFQIISNVGAARSSYIEGIRKAKEGDFEGFRGEQYFCEYTEEKLEIIRMKAPVAIHQRFTTLIMATMPAF